MGGWNLPDDVTESQLPGNRPEDLRWDALVESVEDADVLEQHAEHVFECDHAIYECKRCGVVEDQDNDGRVCTCEDKEQALTFVHCSRSVVDETGTKVTSDPLDCPWVYAELERRFEMGE